MATDGYRGFGVRYDSDAPFQRYQLKYQHAQQGPHGATQGHTKYHQKASIFDLHTPRTKAAGASPTRDTGGKPSVVLYVTNLPSMLACARNRYS